MRVRLTPKSSKNEIGAVRKTSEGPAFEAWVRAAPQNGEANAAAERLLADRLEAPRSAVRVISGAKARVKSLCVVGAVDVIEKRLAAMASLTNE